MNFNFPLFEDVKELNNNRSLLLGICVLILVILLFQNIYHKKFACIRETRKEPLYEKNIELWHEKRREQILKKYPQVKKLEEPNNLLGLLDTIILYVLIAVKFILIYYLVYVWKFNWIYKALIIIVVLPYLAVAVATYTHELGHQTVFKNPKHNKNCLILTDLVYYFGTAFSTFSFMHNHHHDPKFSGTEKDIFSLPYQCEEEIIQNKWYLKLFYQVFYPYRVPIIYKKVFKKPVKLPVGLSLLNMIKVVLMVLFIPKFLVLHYLTELFQFYHPMYPSISEHIQLKPGRMTNSFYGKTINKMTHNLYYHTEHHDFYKINSRNFPKLKKMAPEFYPDTGYKKIPLFYQILFSPKFTMTYRLPDKKNIRLNQELN